MFVRWIVKESKKEGSKEKYHRLYFIHNSREGKKVKQKAFYLKTIRENEEGFSKWRRGAFWKELEKKVSGLDLLAEQKLKLLSQVEKKIPRVTDQEAEDMKKEFEIWNGKLKEIGN